MEGPTSSPAEIGTSELKGRLGIVVGGKTVAVLAIGDGKARVTGGSADVRATFLCTSLEEFQKVARGERNLVVAGLRGDLGIRGDLTFGLMAIRAIQAGMPVDWANPKGG